MNALVQDTRYGFRLFAKNPGFTAVAVLTLALGVGANTAMFTVIDAVLLRPLPFAHAGRLMAIDTGSTHGNLQTTSWPNYIDVRKQSRQLEDVSGYFEDVAVVNTSKGSIDVWSLKVTASLLNLLGVKPELGRPILPSDSQPGAPGVVMLSDALWRRDFGTDPNILGTQIRVGEVPHTVVGVLPPRVPFPHNELDGAGVWVAFNPTPEMLTDRGSDFLYLVGRLKQGARRPAAQAELNAIAQRIRQKDPADAGKLELNLVPYRDVVTNSVRPVLEALAGALLLVLLIACVNVANLLLARCLARRHELAVRAALGASKGRLVRQMIAEGALLSAAGALAGLELATLVLQALRHLPAGLIPRAEEIQLRLPFFLALVGFATLATVLSSLVPALVALRTGPQDALRDAARGASAGRRRSRVAGWMVMGEVALSALLLVATGLMFHTLYNLEKVRLGFDPAQVLSFMAVPANSAGFLASEPETPAKVSVAAQVYEPVLERLRHLPGVIDAAVVSAPPLAHFDMHTDFEIVGQPESREWREQNQARIRAFGGEYCRVLGETVVRGRAIADSDTVGAPFVANINAAFARRYFASEDPIGHQISLGGKDTGMFQPYTIVGVLGNTIQSGLSQSPEPEIDLPILQVPPDSFYYSVLVSFATHYVLKVQGGIDISGAVRAAFRQDAPDYGLDNFQTLSSMLDAATFNQRLGLYLIGSFAAIAVLMVLAGLYGVLSQIVGQRRREIGVRIALGATRESIARMILAQASVLVLAGMGVGLVASVGGGRLIRSFLFGVKPTDVWTYAAVALALAAFGLAAALLPARRASRVNPIEALRCE
jgi:putative ABC transport system permease protein